MEKRCGDPKPSPFIPVKMPLNIPPDPRLRQNCRGCNQPKVGSSQTQSKNVNLQNNKVENVSAALPCSTLPAVGKSTSVFKTINTRQNYAPHFPLHRLANEKRMGNLKRQEAKLAAMRNEMNAFDVTVKQQLPALPDFGISTMASHQTLQGPKSELTVPSAFDRLNSPLNATTTNAAQRTDERKSQNQKKSLNYKEKQMNTDYTNLVSLNDSRGTVGKMEAQLWSVPEKYPMHVRDPKLYGTQADRSGPDRITMRELEDLEEKAAKQDLARIYFTTEASRLIACSSLPVSGKNTNVFRKNVPRKPSIPHFFMDRLENEKKSDNRQKQQDKLRSIKNEMDTFDETLTDRPPARSNFDPTQIPSEKSLQSVKRKLEIKKRQAEQDEKAAENRARIRRRYCHEQMIPNILATVDSSVLYYSIKRACKLTGEEKLLAAEFLGAAYQGDVFEEHRKLYDEEEEYLEEEAEETGDNDQVSNEKLDPCSGGGKEHRSSARKKKTRSKEGNDKTDVGEVEIQRIDPTESPEESKKNKGRGLHFEEPVSEREDTGGEIDDLNLEGPKISLKFSLPKNFESKRATIQRKKTGFRPKDSLDDDDDDDHDNDHGNNDLGLDEDDEVSEGVQSAPMQIENKEGGALLDEKDGMQLNEEKEGAEMEQLETGTEEEKLEEEEGLKEQKMEEMLVVENVESEVLEVGNEEEELEEDEEEGEELEDEEEEGSSKEGEGEEEETLDDEEGEEEEDVPRSKLSFKGKMPCSGPSSRKSFAFAELGYISYGMNCGEHEKKFLEHRIKELMQLQETWSKGLDKPTRLLSKIEKRHVPLSSQFTTKRKPAFNILDPHIPRPKFNGRIKRLIEIKEREKRTKLNRAEDGIEQ